MNTKNTTSTPNPMMMPQQRVQHVAAIQPDAPVTGQVDDESVVKTKHLHHHRGATVRALIKGETVGKERVVKQVTRIDDGARVKVTWADGSVTEHAAAYRWKVLVAAPEQPAKASKPRRQRRPKQVVVKVEGPFETYPLDTRTREALTNAKQALS